VPLCLFFCDNMEGASVATNPRTVDEVFKDFKGRRLGMLKALTSGRSMGGLIFGCCPVWKNCSYFSINIYVFFICIR